MLDFFSWMENKQFSGIKPDDVLWWSKYTQTRIFSSPEEARDWVFNKRQFADQQTTAELFGKDGPEFNRQFADNIPIYQSGKSFKIGKRIRTDNRMRLSSLKVFKPSLEELNMVAQANGVEDYKFHPVKWIPFKDMIDKNDVYATQKGEIQKINNLATQIKQSGWIEAVIYDVRGCILEGQHRTRAMKVLGFNTVPAVGIEYF